MKFRKKPVVIEATQWLRNGDHPADDAGRRKSDGTTEREGTIVGYFRRLYVSGAQPCKQCCRLMSDHGWINTLEGGHIVCPGDWIITGVKGERYPCKPDIFEATYEKKTPMADTRTERVARAICLANDNNPDQLLAGSDPPYYRWMAYIAHAQAAIVAMKETTND